MTQGFSLEVVIVHPRSAASSSRSQEQDREPHPRRGEGGAPSSHHSAVNYRSGILSSCVAVETKGERLIHTPRADELE